MIELDLGGGTSVLAMLAGHLQAMEVELPNTFEGGWRAEEGEGVSTEAWLSSVRSGASLTGS